MNYITMNYVIEMSGIIYYFSVNQSHTFHFIFTGIQSGFLQQRAGGAPEAVFPLETFAPS